MAEHTTQGAGRSIAGGDAGTARSAWHSRDILRAALLVAAVYLALRLLWFASSLFFVVFLGILFGIALAAGVDALKRLGVPRGIGAVLIVVFALLVLVGMGRLMAPTLTTQFEELRTTLPAAIDRLEEWIDARRGGVVEAVLPEEDAQASGEDPDSRLRDRVVGELGNLTRYLFPFLSSTLAVLGGIVAILFIAIYFAVSPDLYRRGFLHLVPHRSRPKAEEVLGSMGAMLRRWLVTQSIAMLAVGAVTTGTLLLLDVPAAVALGVLAGLLEFIPILGPILASIPAIAMAFLSSPQKALLVAGAFVIIQQLEGEVLTPLLMKHGVDLPPVLTLVVQSTMAAVFGFIGLIVAVPLLTVTMVPIRLLYVEDRIGDPMEVPGRDG